MKDDTQPFNDVIAHVNKIEGNVGNVAKTNLKKQPTPIRVIGYHLFTFFLSVAT